MRKWTPEQEKIFAADGNVLVSASAGSGKTTVMVQRIIDKLVANTPVEKILVLSYTNASAADMRAKIVDGLFKAVKEGDYSDEIKESLRLQLDNLPFSEIGTMDSFCGKIIRENFEVLGISPRINQMDEAEENEAKHRIIEKLLAAEYDRESPEFLRVVNKIASIADDAPLSEIILRLYNAASINPDPAEFKRLLRDSATDNPDSVYGKIILNHYTDTAKEYLFFAESAKDKLCLSEEPLYFEAYKGAIDALRAISEIKTAAEAKSVLDALPDYPVRARTKDNEADKQFVKKIRDTVKAIAGGLRGDLFVDYTGYNAGDVKTFIDEVLKLEDEFEKEYSEYKLAGDKVDFYDLSRLAIKLLSDEERAKAVAAKFYCIFVDEYQDINPLQECILQKLSGDNLFMVGDVKQSIYAFRNADATIFSGKKKQFESNPSEGSALSMTENFRSTSNILEFADRVFSAVMTEEHGGVNYGAESRFLHDTAMGVKEIGRDVEVDVYRVLPAERDDTVKGVYSVTSHVETAGREEAAAYREGKETARKIKALIKNYRVEAENRNLRYGDIAVLFKKRGGAETFLKALADENIPYVSDGFTADQGKRYVKQLITLLKVLDNAQNDVELVGFLLSYFGNMSENAVAEMRAENSAVNVFEGLCKKAEENGEVGMLCKSAVKIIYKWRERAAYLTVGELLNDIISETGFDAYVLSREDGINEYRAVTEFIASVGRVDGGSDVQSYLSYLDNAERRDVTVPAVFGNAVRISTVHGSKGLEYPVVFLACADASWGGRQKGDIIFDKALGVGIKLYNEETRSKKASLAYTALRLASDRRDAEENIRLMYVALTRAKEKLIITAKVKNSFEGKLDYPAPVVTAASFLDLLTYAAAKDSVVRGLIGGVTELEPEEVNLKEKTQVTFTAPDKTYIDEISKVINFVYQNKPATKIGLKYTVSELNRMEDDVAYVPSLYKGEATDMRKTGIAYHTVMENIDLSFTTLSEVNLFIAGLAERGILTSAEAEAVDGAKILECINNPIVKEGIRGKYLREQPFMLRVRACDAADTEASDSILVQGTADLVFLNGENAVVDFKYSTLPDDKLAEKYEKQLNLYKMAVETAFRVKIHKKLLYSFTSGRFIEIN